jgi:hypothetical protein
MKTNNKRGRPIKRSSEKREENLLIRLDALEKTTFKAASDLAGIPLSSWAREKLRHAAIRELEEAGIPIQLLENIKDING